MKNTLIVITDLEELKAYWLDNNPSHSTPRLELVEQFHTRANRKLVDEMSDLAGRFPRVAVTRDITGGMGHGERHNIELEKRRRCTRQLAGHINSLLRNNAVERCYFAASREISHPLLRQLDPRARSKIEMTVACDLTKLDKSKLLGHFKPGTRVAAAV